MAASLFKTKHIINEMELTRLSFIQCDNIETVEAQIEGHDIPDSRPVWFPHAGHFKHTLCV